MIENETSVYHFIDDVDQILTRSTVQTAAAAALMDDKWILNGI